MTWRHPPSRRCPRSRCNSNRGEVKNWRVLMTITNDTAAIRKTDSGALDLSTLEEVGS